MKTQYGWHVIKKEDERDSPAPEFSQVKDEIRQIIAQENYIALTTKARETYQVEILDETLKGEVEALE